MLSDCDTGSKDESTMALLGGGQTPVIEERMWLVCMISSDLTRVLGPDLEGHHELLEGGVAGALADAVSGDLDLARTGAQHGRNAISFTSSALDLERQLCSQGQGCLPGAWLRRRWGARAAARSISRRDTWARGPSRAAGLNRR